MPTLLFSLLLLLISSAPVAGQSDCRLRVVVEQVRPEKGGELRIALFRGESGWPKFEKALAMRKIPADQSRHNIIFDNLPPADDYAVEVHHDANSNGKLDMRWLPYPKPREGVGVSNNRIGFATPSFSSARFTLSPPSREIRIRLEY